MVTKFCKKSIAEICLPDVCILINLWMEMISPGASNSNCPQQFLAAAATMLAASPQCL